MIRATFKGDTGFTVSGHSGYAEAGADIVCAAVSSAVSLCECAIRDVLGADVSTAVSEENTCVSLELRGDSKEARDMICALMIHLASLHDDYPEYIEVLEV
ncbi:MAG: ribosomal-processing cysteine protease Prp [Clostridia bacterium]